MRQYETMELSFQGTAPEGSQAVVDLTAEFVHGDKRVCVNGFYAGDNTYKIRFFADEPGEYHYTVRGLFSDSGSFLVDPVRVPVRKNADGLLLQLPSEHGIVHPDGCHLRFQDGTYFQAFGTTVYALMHQKDALINETMETLKHSPFNKIRLCVFPKHYRYNTNEPPVFRELPFHGTDGERSVLNGELQLCRPCGGGSVPLVQRLPVLCAGGNTAPGYAHIPD